MSFRIKKGDTVMVISGKDRGETGKVLTVLPKDGKAIVENINFITRHERQRSQLQQGGIMKKEAPIPLSKLMIICPRCGKPTRIGAKITDEGTRVRICRKCKAQI
ncbi:50S ribosomal protein L24 [Candidatus Sumerlaeota bacterium]|nr:50S ribosomal protein L24 [Candidatus Sumerlaeota bacterium]